MGCDIHAYREKQVGGKWVAADRWTEDRHDPGHKTVEWDDRVYQGRCYMLFGLLAHGVRTEHPFSFVVRGMPFDASQEVAAEAKRWDTDGHNHSYIYLHELRDMLAFSNRKRRASPA